MVVRVLSLYKSCKTAVSVDRELSSSFSVKIDVHQGSALSPLLFIMGTDVLTEHSFYARDVSLTEFLYTGNLILCGESLDEVMGKYGQWENAVEGKGVLRVSVGKAKGMPSLFGKISSVLKVDPCGVCGEQVGFNSIQCAKCQSWFHHHCYDMPRQVHLLLCHDVSVCGTCLNQNCSAEENFEIKRIEDVSEEVEKFFYLSDIISCYGGVSEAVSAKIGGM